MGKRLLGVDARSSQVFLYVLVPVYCCVCDGENLMFFSFFSPSFLDRLGLEVEEMDF